MKVVGPVTVILWLVAGVVASWADHALSPRIITSLCFAAAAACAFARAGRHREGFDNGYSIAARHAVDIARIEASHQDNPHAKKAVHDTADRLRTQLDLEGARNP